MPTRSVMRRAAAAHLFLRDVVLAVIVVVISVTVATDAPGRLPAPDGANGVLVTVACLALVVRRRRPLPVWGLVLVCAMTGLVVDGGHSPVLPAALVAIYSLVVRLPLRHGLAVVLSSAAALVVVVGTTVAWTTPLLYIALAWSGLAGALGMAVRSHRAVLAAAENRAQAAEATREQEAQRRVAEERLRIARDLHDVVAHHISVIGVQSTVVQHLLRSDPARAETAIGHVQNASEQVIAEMATMLRVLRAHDEAPSLEPAPGLAQVETLIESSRQAGLRVVSHTSGRHLLLAPLVDLTAYRLVQETLTNAAKHGTGEVTLSITYNQGTVQVEVVNRAASPAAGVGTGHGLLGMRERVAAVGGTVQTGLRPVPGGEIFVVHAELPALSGQAEPSRQAEPETHDTDATGGPR